MAKPISELTNDIRKLIEDGRAAAGPEIVFSLQSKGPWWTGNFGEEWRLGSRPIRATVERKRDWRELLGGGDPPRPVFSPKTPLPLPINKSLYIGNAAKYAAYVVNDANAKINGETYQGTRPPQRSTAPSGVRWYEIYTVTGRDNGLFHDLDKAFGSVRLG